MKPFNLENYIKNPNQILVLEHYKEPREYWIIKAATVVMGKKLAITTPDTGYQTDEIEVADGDCIRDKDHNLVGYIRAVEPGDLIPISLKELAGMVADMEVGATIDFNRNEDCDHWGITKLNCLDTVIYICGRYGGGYHEICETIIVTVSAFPPIPVFR